ncbi:MAG: hypothetical protein J07HQW1_01497 [Haloquadratum walsbyi J07HQW1]|uniref:Uncharacterized protein n=1 Tax=Haloquadratum walsbyi J07HQW1 TaxID=1238424 RepID=U1N4Z3_9EURY|nr:MAG: hypothetical protein J07HQW1_01497 [Haloquadratum walsbyi J07HQW1]
MILLYGVRRIEEKASHFSAERIFEACSLEQTSISKPASLQLGQPAGWVAHGGIPRVQSWEEVK